MSDDSSEPTDGDRHIETEIIDPEVDMKFLRVTSGDDELAMIPWGEALQIAAAVEEEKEATA